MNDQEAVQPEQEVSYESVVEQSQESVEREETQVPLHALQRERKKRQELEEELKFHREQQRKSAQPNDDSRYESATKEDLGKSREETIRIIEERKWSRDNPEKYQRINDDLPQFLKQRPNLASAIEASTNRYEEAWELMQALTPKQQQQIKVKPKQDAPGSPSGVPKSAAMSEAVDVMRMTDSEFHAWRQSKRRR